MTFPCANELALHMINSMVDQDIDVAHSKHFREGQSVGHAFVFVYHRIMRPGRSPPSSLCRTRTTRPRNRRRSAPTNTGSRSVTQSSHGWQ